MMESICRGTYQKYCVDPLAKWLVNYTAIKPAGLTFLALLFGLLCSLSLKWQHSISASIFLLLSGYFDVLDGTLARLSQTSSATGAVLDIVVDRMVEFAVILGLYAVDPLIRATSCMWMLGSSFICVTSFLVVGIFVQNESVKSFHYSVGLMERAEAFVFFILMIWLPSWFVILAWLYTILVSFTAFFRVIEFVRLQTIKEA